VGVRKHPGLKSRELIDLSFPSRPLRIGVLRLSIGLIPRPGTINHRDSPAVTIRQYKYSDGCHLTWEAFPECNNSRVRVYTRKKHSGDTLVEIVLVRPDLQPPFIGGYQYGACPKNETCAFSEGLTHHCTGAGGVGYEKILDWPPWKEHLPTRAWLTTP